MCVCVRARARASRSTPAGVQKQFSSTPAASSGQATSFAAHLAAVDQHLHISLSSNGPAI
eukprot:1159534-Pelagomonas_calceolata.AAC.4